MLIVGLLRMICETSLMNPLLLTSHYGLGRIFSIQTTRHAILMKSFIQTTRHAILMKPFIRTTRHAILMKPFIRTTRHAILMKPFIRTTRHAILMKPFIRTTRHAILMKPFTLQPDKILRSLDWRRSLDLFGDYSFLSSLLGARSSLLI